MTNKEQAVSDAVETLQDELDFYDNNRAAGGLFDPDAVRTVLAAMKAASHPLEQQQAVSWDVVAKERADWLLDAVACATQDRRFLRGDPAYDENAGEAILLNGEKAISAALTASGMREALEALRCARFYVNDDLGEVIDELFARQSIQAQEVCGNSAFCRMRGGR